MMTFDDYICLQAKRLERMGRMRTAETYLASLRSFRNFLGEEHVAFRRLDNDLFERYEAWLRQRFLSRNSTSFYMRVLRSNYNMAVGEGLVEQKYPFRTVYTGVCKTRKRAISLSDIKVLKRLDLSHSQHLAQARDFFLFSFYMRGMAFVDMAYLRKCDLHRNFITYTRRKTGQQLVVRWERAMQEIVDRYHTSTQFLLPIIRDEDGDERRQYLNKMLLTNRKLKEIATMAHLSIPLTMYVARHTWASIAYAKHIPLSVISEAMGHDSESTTQIYLRAVQSSIIDEANMRIIQCL